MEEKPQVGDYIRIDWTVPGDSYDGSWSESWIDKHVWVEGEIVRIHRPKLDLVADVRVDRSNWMRVGSVEGIGIEHGAKRILRPGGVDPPRASMAFGRPMLPDDSSFHAWPPAALPLRPDGFSQAQVDAAKAVLLTPVMNRGGR